MLMRRMYVLLTLPTPPPSKEKKKQVYWSGTGSLVAITAEDSFYILRFDRDAYNAKIEEGAEITDEGVEEAFEVVADVPEGYLPSFHSIATPLTFT
jgi:hypothetical protein